MPLNRRNTKDVSRTVYCGITQVVFLLKRGNNQKMGTVRTIKLFRCWRESKSKSGEVLQDDMSTGNRTTWHIPGTELKRTGIAFIDALDRIYDPIDKEYWQAEAPDTIDVQLWGNEIKIACELINPPVSGSI